MRKKNICVILSLCTLLCIGCGQSDDAIDNHLLIQSDGTEKWEEAAAVQEESIEDTEKITDKNVKTVVKNMEESAEADSNSAVEVQMRRIEQTYMDEENNNLVETVFEYPQITIQTNTELANNLTQYFRQEQKNLIDTAKQFQKSAKEQRDFMSEDELNYWEPYTVVERCSIKRNDGKVLSLVTKYEEYGGVDSIYSEEKAINYDVEQTDTLTVQDIVKNIEEFDQFVQESDVDLQEILFEDDKWYMDEEGIAMMKDQMLLDDMGDDAPTILISYEKLQNYLKERYLP